MPRKDTHAARPSLARLSLAALVALSVGGSSLAAVPAATAQPVGSAKPVTCDGFPVGSQRVTKVTIHLRTGPIVIKETVEECGGDGKWAPQPT